MEPRAPDVALAIELFERIDAQLWGQRTEGLFEPRPFIRIEDAERLDAVQAWLAAHAAQATSGVEAALRNFARVLQDFLLVLDHDMEQVQGIYRVAKWYAAWGGHPDRHREEQRYEAHVSLLMNLGAELARAMNLIGSRVGQIDADALAGYGAIVIASGPSHAAMHAARYSAKEARESQPYPGRSYRCQERRLVRPRGPAPQLIVMVVAGRGGGWVRSARSAQSVW